MNNESRFTNYTILNPAEDECDRTSMVAELHSEYLKPAIAKGGYVTAAFGDCSPILVGFGLDDFQRSSVSSFLAWQDSSIDDLEKRLLEYRSRWTRKPVLESGDIWNSVQIRVRFSKKCVATSERIALMASWLPRPAVNSAIEAMDRVETIGSFEVEVLADWDSEHRNCYRYRDRAFVGASG